MLYPAELGVRTARRVARRSAFVKDDDGAPLSRPRRFVDEPLGRRDLFFERVETCRKVIRRDLFLGLGFVLLFYRQGCRVDDGLGRRGGRSRDGRRGGCRSFTGGWRG